MWDYTRIYTNLTVLGFNVWKEIPDNVVMDLDFTSVRILPVVHGVSTNTRCRPI